MKNLRLNINIGSWQLIPEKEAAKYLVGSDYTRLGWLCFDVIVIWKAPVA